MPYYEYVKIYDFLKVGKLKPGDPVLNIFTGWFLYVGIIGGELNGRDYEKIICRELNSSTIHHFKSDDVVVRTTNFESTINFK